MKRILFSVEKRWEYSKNGNIVVSTYGIPKTFRQAFLKILVATSAYYRQIFGNHSIDWVELNVRKLPKMCLRLWTNGSDRIYFTLSKKKQLEPPESSNIFNIHGLAHELGHIILYRSLINIQNLPVGWGEGWAIYLASFVAVPYLFSKFGPSLWPYPYDYLQTEGPEKYLCRFKSASAKKKEPILEVVYKLHMLHQHLGDSGFQKYFCHLLKQPLRSDAFYKKLSKKMEKAGF
jgi:hypothetical protein